MEQNLDLPRIRQIDPLVPSGRGEFFVMVFDLERAWDILGEIRWKRDQNRLDAVV